MIITAIVNLVALVIKGIIAIIPDLSGIVLPTGMTEWFVNIVNMSAYFLPCLIDINIK